MLIGKHLITGGWLEGPVTFASSPAHVLAHDFAVGAPAVVYHAAKSDLGCLSQTCRHRTQPAGRVSALQSMLEGLITEHSA